MKIISFRFDDGLFDGATKASRILSPYSGSFFIVKNWLENSNMLILDNFNMGKYHGSVDKWKLLSAKGHDIQSHSCSHQMFSKLSEIERISELTESLNVIKGIHSGPYIFCYPYNDITEDNLQNIGYDAGGFVTNTSSHPPPWNDLNKLNEFRLKSWAIREQHYDHIIDQLSIMPDNSWAILALHSLDNEGFQPWSSTGFEKLIGEIRNLDLAVMTVRDVINIQRNLL